MAAFDFFTFAPPARKLRIPPARQPKLSPLLQGAASGHPTRPRQPRLQHSLREQPLLRPRCAGVPVRTDPDAAAALLRWVSGKRSIKGTARGDTLAALREFGLTPQRVEVPPCNLRAWLGRVEPGVTEAEYLVVITGHYVVVHGDRWDDSRCHFGKPHARSPYLRRRVVTAWRITR